MKSSFFVAGSMVAVTWCVRFGPKFCMEEWDLGTEEMRNMLEEAILGVERA